MSSFQEDIHSAVLGFVPFVIECIFYGVYSVLFSLCIYVLRKRREMQHRWLHFTFIVALYSLATVHMVLMSTLAFKFDGILLGYSAFIQSLGWDHSFHLPTVLALSLALKVLFLVSNLLADTILIYRCYLVWGRNRRVIILPALGYICTIVFFGVQFASDSTAGLAAVIAFLAATFVTNLITVGLTAGRIWWIARKSRALLGLTTKRRYSTAIAVVLESGIVYPVMLFAGTMTLITGGSIGTWIFVGIIYQAVGIAPTLVIVRVSLGVTHDDVESSMTAFRAQDASYC
ncbi:hypothetical protein C8J56DRAFT_950300 [Mycena floridula]|nr:hypothetical protein C8J56DRAFT_950300 [Mycena floridula]